NYQLPLTSTLFPYTTLFRSITGCRQSDKGGGTFLQELATSHAWRFKAKGLSKEDIFAQEPRRLSICATRIRAASICATSNYLARSEEHTSELQSRFDLVCRL